MKYISFLTNNYRFINTTCSTFVSIPLATFNIFSAPLEFERELMLDLKHGELEASEQGPSKITSEKIKIAKQLHADPNIKISDILQTLDACKPSSTKCLICKSFIYSIKLRYNSEALCRLSFITF